MILAKLQEKQIPYLLRSKKVQNFFLAFLLICDFFLRKFLIKNGFLKFKKKSHVIKLVQDFKIDSRTDLKLHLFPVVPINKIASSTSKISKKDFDKDFEDIEEFFKLHRFSWLWNDYMADADVQSFNKGLDLINLWISKDYSYDKNREIFESYSISERVINWIFFLIYSKKIIDINDNHINLISQSIVKQVQYLVENLEYKGQLTNNHILKNAQALYITGVFLGDNKLQQIGKTIIKAEYADHVKDGILQEDSTHYQLIVTKWFIEVYFSAGVAADLEFKNWLQPRISSLISVSRYIFSEENLEPFFGDISPDFPAKELKSFPFLDFVDDKIPWSFLMADLPSIEKTSSNFNVINSWVHKKFGKYDLFLMAKNNGIGSHGHEDNGSFILYYDGHAISQDLGRKNYTSETLSIDQQKQTFHTIACMDNNPWDIKTIPTFIKHFFISKFKVTEDSESSFKYRVISFDSSIILERSFTYDSVQDTLILRDKLFSGHHTYSLTIPVEAPVESLRIENSKVSFTNKKQFKFAILSNCEFDIKEFFMSHNYGTQDRCALLKFKKILKQNDLMEFQFKHEAHHA